MSEFNIQDSVLGKTAATPEKYDVSLLFRIPRIENRIRYGIDGAHLPFVGFDVWNCYEVSFLTDNGLPVSKVMKLIYPSDSKFLVESKSLKLYLNSFNMDRFGKTIADAESKVAEMIYTDLCSLLEVDVKVALFNAQSKVETAFPELRQADLSSMVPILKQESMEFSRFVESPELLRGMKTEIIHEYAFRSDLLRSNCRVTNQPDWGDLFLKLTTKHEIDLSSIMEYLVSFRKENHFHEEVVEMIYKRFWDVFEPEALMVAAMYTRRGGIDINPIRASHAKLIDEMLVSDQSMVAKTLRQ
jgi:7-cyano-7-deazaguanine reductase